MATKDVLRTTVTCLGMFMVFCSSVEAVLNCVGGPDKVVYRRRVNLLLGNNPSKAVFQRYEAQTRADDCASKCSEYSGWQCNSFEYNPNTFVCIIYPYTVAQNGVQSGSGWELHDNPACSEGTYPPGYTTTTTTPSYVTTVPYPTTQRPGMTTTQRGTPVVTGGTPVVTGGSSAVHTTIPPTVPLSSPNVGSSNPPVITTTLNPASTSRPDTTPATGCYNVWEYIENHEVPTTVAPIGSPIHQTVVQCMTACRAVATCRSLTYSLATQTCKLYRQEWQALGHLTNVAASKTATHFYQWSCNYNVPSGICGDRERLMWKVKRSTRLNFVGTDKQTFTEPNRAACELRCLRDTQCKSIDWRSTELTCDINKRQSTPGAETSNTAYTNLERVCFKDPFKCPTGQNLFWYGWSERHLLQNDDKVFMSVVNEEACQNLCLAAQNILCRSVEYQKGVKQCILSRASSKDATPADDPTKTRIFLEYQCEDRLASNYCGSEVREWKEVDRKIIRDKNDVVLANVQSVDRCKTECEMHTRPYLCRSVEYNTVQRTCTLCAENTTQGGILDNANPTVVALYEWTCKPNRCALDEVTWYRTTRTYIVGHDDRVYTGSVLSPADCLNLCKTEQGFVCRSAEYNAEQLTCRLSRWTVQDYPAMPDTTDVPNDYYEWQCRDTPQGMSGKCDAGEELVWLQKNDRTLTRTPISTKLVQSLLLCETLCLTNTRCRSLAYTSGAANVCDLFSEGQGQMRSALGTIHLAWSCLEALPGKCDANEIVHWSVQVNREQRAANTTQHGVDEIAKCQLLCLASNEPACKSIDYSVTQKVCHLSPVSNRQLHVSTEAYSFYTWSCGSAEDSPCSAGSAVEWKEHESSYLSGHYDSVLEMGVSITKCAQLCLRLTTFLCRSFDFRESSGSRPSVCELNPVSPRISTVYQLKGDPEYVHNYWICTQIPPPTSGTSSFLRDHPFALFAMTVISVTILRTHVQAF